MNKSESGGFMKILRDIQRNKFWIPEEIFKEIHATFSMWAIEMIILRDDKILLTKAPGASLGKWHLPGGYTFWDEDINLSCRRISEREINLSVKPVKTLGVYKWEKDEHPYGRPLSVFMLCKPLEKIKESPSVKFFDMKKLPSPMISCQRKFVESFYNKKNKE